MNSEDFQKYEDAIMKAVSDYRLGNENYDNEKLLWLQQAATVIHFSKLQGSVVKIVDIIEVILGDIEDNKQKMKEIENITSELSELKESQKSLCKVVEAIMSDLE